MRTKRTTARSKNFAAGDGHFAGKRERHQTSITSSSSLLEEDVEDEDDGDEDEDDGAR